MPAPTKSRTLALPSGGTGLHSAGRSRRPDSQGFVHGDDPSSPKLHVSVSTSALNPFITLTSYKTLHGSQHAAPTQGGSNSSPATPTGASSSKPRSPYLVKPSHLQHASAERRAGPSQGGVRDSLESIRDGIRRLHSALTSQPLGPAGAANTGRASGSGASGASMLKQHRDDSTPLPHSMTRTSSGSSTASAPSPCPTPAPTADAADSLGGSGGGPDSGGGGGSVEAVIEAAGSSKAALLELLASKAAQLLHTSVTKVRVDGLASGLSVAADGPGGAGSSAGAAGQAAVTRPSTAVPKTRSAPSGAAAAGGRQLPPRPASALPSSGAGGHALPPPSPSASAVSGPLQAWGPDAAAISPLGGSTLWFCSSAMVATALLDAVALMGDLQRQAAGRNTALRVAEEQVAETRAKLGLSQQDNTLLRNTLAELQAGSRSATHGASDIKEMQRPSSARPLGADASHRPDAALLKQVQSLSKEVFDLKRQLEAATRKQQSLLEQLEAASKKQEEAGRKAKQQQEQLEAQLDVARKALAASEGREGKATKERDQLSARCKKLESDLGEAAQKCDRLAQECDEERRRRQEAEARLSVAAEEARRRDARGGTGHAAACQTDVDVRDEQLRVATSEAEELRRRLSDLQGELQGSCSQAAAAQVGQTQLAEECERLRQECGRLLEKCGALGERLAAAEAAAEDAGRALAEAEAKLVAGRTREQVLAAGADRAAHEQRQAKAALEQALRERDEQVRALQDAISGLEAQLAQAVSERDALSGRVSELVSEKEALVSQHGDLEAARAEREERLRVLEGVLQQVQDLEAALGHKQREVQALQRQLTDSQGRWEAAQIDLEAERRRLEAEWQEASSLRVSLQQEASTIKAMGTLVQAKTLKFDLSGMISASPPGGRAGRPMSAMPAGAGGGVGAGGVEASGAAAMRLGALVKELQEQLALQGRQLGERQRQLEDAQALLLADRQKLRELEGERGTGSGASDEAVSELGRALEAERGAREAAEVAALQARARLEEAAAKLLDAERQALDARRRAQEAEYEAQAATSRLEEADRKLADLSRQAQERGVDDEQLRALLQAAQDEAREAREGEVTAKNVNRELHKMCERLQKHLTAKTHEADALQRQLDEHDMSARSLQLELSQQRASVATLRERLEEANGASASPNAAVAASATGTSQQQQQDVDYERLLQQLQLARHNLVACTEKLEGAERTIQQQDERIALLQSRVKGLEDELDAVAFNTIALAAQPLQQGGAAASSGAAGLSMHSSLVAQGAARPGSASVTAAAAAFAGAGVGLRGALAAAAGAGVGGAAALSQSAQGSCHQRGDAPMVQPTTVAAESSSGSSQGYAGSGYFLRPSSASLVGKVMEHERAGAYGLRSSSSNAMRPTSAAMGGAGWGLPPSGRALVQQPARAMPSGTSGLITAAGAAGLGDDGQPGSARSNGFTDGSFTAGASAAQGPGRPRVMSAGLQPAGTAGNGLGGGASGQGGRPSTAVARKTMLLLSTKTASSGLDDWEGGDAGEWVPV